MQNVSTHDEHGNCPWCGTSMEIGDEDPILERICMACVELPEDELHTRHPAMASRYAEAVAG